MPRDANGNYTLPPSYHVQTGDTVLPVQHNPPFEDVANALTNSIDRDGRTVMTGPLQMGGNRITNVAPGSLGGDVATLKQVGQKASFKTVQDLRADTSMSYTTGPSIVEDGDIITAQGFRYVVAASDALPFDKDTNPDGYHLINAGEVKLKFLATAGEVYPEALGDAIDGDDRFRVQKAFDIAPILNATVIIRQKFDVLSLAGPTIDGAAGDCALIISEAHNTRIEGRGKGEITTPKNSHGIYVCNADDFSISGVKLSRNVEGAAGTIGHLIGVFGRCKRPKIYGNRLADGDDTAISLQPHLAEWAASATDLGASANIFDFGATDISIRDNTIVGNTPLGDAGIEIMAATGGIISGNNITETHGHGIRTIGFRNGLVCNNDIYDACLQGPPYYGIAAQSGGWAVAGIYHIIPNDGTLYAANNIRDCWGGLNTGIGTKAYFSGNTVSGEVTRAITILSGAIIAGSVYADPSRKTAWASVFSGNVIDINGDNPILISVTETTSTDYDIADGLEFIENTIRWGGGTAFLDNGGTFPLNRFIRNLKLIGNTFEPSDRSATSTAVGLTMAGLVDPIIENNTWLGRPGNMLVLFAGGYSGVQFDGNKRIQVERASNAMRTTASTYQSWETGQRVRFKTTGTLPTALSTSSIYYIIVDQPYSVRLATSEANALSGSGIALSDAGSGYHFIVVI